MTYCYIAPIYLIKIYKIEIPEIRKGYFNALVIIFSAALIQEYFRKID